MGGGAGFSPLAATGRASLQPQGHNIISSRSTQDNEALDSTDPFTSGASGGAAGGATGNPKAKGSKLTPILERLAVNQVCVTSFVGKSIRFWHCVARGFASQDRHVGS